MYTLLNSGEKEADELDVRVRPFSGRVWVCVWVRIWACVWMHHWMWLWVATARA